MDDEPEESGHRGACAAAFAGGSSSGVVRAAAARPASTVASSARGHRDAAPVRQGRSARTAASRTRRDSRSGRGGCGSRWRAATSLRLRTIRLRSTRLIWPFSSDTTTTIASVCSAMPRAARWRVPKRSVWIVVSARGSSAPAARIESLADDDGPVVEGGPRREDRQQQVGRQVAVDHHAGLRDLLEPGLALDDDERADALGGHDRRGPRHLDRDVVRRPRFGRRQEPGERARRGRSARARGEAPAGRPRRGRTGRRRRRPAGSGSGGRG